MAVVCRVPWSLAFGDQGRNPLPSPVSPNALLTAELIPQTRQHGLSLGDRACLALAIHHQATAYTTNTAWRNLRLGIDIEVIR